MIATLRDWTLEGLTQMFEYFMGETNAVLHECLKHASYASVDGATLYYHFREDARKWFDLCNASYNRLYLTQKIATVIPGASVCCVMDGAPEVVGPPEAGTFPASEPGPDAAGLPEARA